MNTKILGEKAGFLQQEIPNSYILDQYANPNNPNAHYCGTAQEIIDDFEKSNRKMEDKFKIMTSVIKDQVENKIESKMRSEFESMTEVLKKNTQ